MKSIKRVLAIVLTIAIITSFAIVNTIAEEPSVVWLNMDKTDGLYIDFDSVGNTVDLVEYNDEPLTSGTDYTVTSNKIIFSKDFMNNNYIKDLKKINVTIDGILCYVNLYYVGDLKGTLFTKEIKASDIIGSDDEILLKYYDKKGILKENSSNGITTYSLNDKVVYTIDTNANKAYPSDVSIYDNITTFDLTFADGFDLCKSDASYDLYLTSRTLAIFGTRGIIDLSSIKPGVSTVLVNRDNFEIAEMFLMPLMYLEADGEITLDVNDEEDDFSYYTVKDLQGNTLAVFIADEEKYTLSVIVTEGLTAKENVFTNYYDEDEDFNVLSGLIFKKPEIISGDKCTWEKGNSDLTFKSSANFDEFEKVVLDGEELDPSNYTKTEGSTIITLKKSLLTTLKAGEHTLGIVSYSGTATATFTVAEEKVTKAEEVANTSDNNMIGAFVALSTFSALSFVSLKKKEN